MVTCEKTTSDALEVLRLFNEENYFTMALYINRMIRNEGGNKQKVFADLLGGLVDAGVEDAYYSFFLVLFAYERVNQLKGIA